MLDQNQYGLINTDPFASKKTKTIFGSQRKNIYRKKTNSVMIIHVGKFKTAKHNNIISVNSFIDSKENKINIHILKETVRDIS